MRISSDDLAVLWYNVAIAKGGTLTKSPGKVVRDLPERGPQKGLETVDNQSLSPPHRTDTAPEEPHDREIRECRSCYGGGQCLESREVAFGWYESFPVVCNTCKGTGEVSVFLYEHARRA